jgi:hypothetical protein
MRDLFALGFQDRCSHCPGGILTADQKRELASFGLLAATVTGASSKSAPCCSASFANSAIHSGLTVLDSMRIAPFLVAASAPSLPIQTSRDAVSSASMLMMTDPSLTASAGVEANRAPASVSGLAFAAVRLYTVTENPAFSRLAAIPDPIVPSQSIATLSPSKTSSCFFRRANAP